MSTINQIIIGALTPITANVWAVELPPNPTFPAIVFEVETVAEDTWVQGGGYDQHTVTIYILNTSLDSVMTIMAQVNNAVEALPECISIGDSGDADYEDDANVYSYFLTYTLRTQRY